MAGSSNLIYSKYIFTSQRDIVKFENARRVIQEMQGGLAQLQPLFQKIKKHAV